jgi:adenosylmethionine-8-amino-7-oxononanoate aminotransferase
MSASPKDSTTAELDKAFVWHPFTQMREWTASATDIVVIVEGEGAILRDDQGREYLDGNASIWTNLHGHRNPVIDDALRQQLQRIAHCSFLGTTNDVAPRLASELVALMNQPEKDYRVFLSDDGSTAMEAGIKMVVQARVQRGEEERIRFVSLQAGYHGDTIGAMSVAHSEFFHRPFRSLLFPTREVPSPACYRCPHNRAQPQRGKDARLTRDCNWECVDQLREALDEKRDTIAAFILEPLVQGAAGMTMHPPGYLQKAAALCAERGIWLMLDEVLTGFGRTGAMFAFEKENVKPDVLALGKGITGGYLPLAATLASGEIYDAFLGEYSEFKTFFHGHSYSGNPLGSAAARASLAIFRQDAVLEKNRGKADHLAQAAAVFWSHPNVGDIRQEGMICAIELVLDFDSRAPFPAEQRMGHRVTEAARKYGLLTRPVGNVLVLMPPYCTTLEQIDQMADALWRALNEVLPFK